MPTDVVMPQMGESIFEGTITRWLKKAGDAVEKDEPLFEISTDKVDAEIPSPVAGVLVEIKAQAGETVQINTVVAVVGESGSGSAAAAESAAPPAASDTQAKPAAPPASGSRPDLPLEGAPAPGQGLPVVMPQMGESIFEGTITRWLKQAGDRVEKDEPLFEISTDKVDAEIPSPAAGILTEIRTPQGETVQINTVVAVIGGATPAAGSTATVAQPDGTSSAASLAQPAPKEPESPQANTHSASSNVEAREAAAPSPASLPAPAPDAAPEPGVSAEPIRSSPLVRRIARENNIDLRQVRGTGSAGRITKEDILAYQAGGAGKSARVLPTPDKLASRPATVTPAAVATAPRSDTVPMSRMRSIIAQRMLDSKLTSPHAYSVYKVDMTRVVKLRERTRAAFERQNGVKLTYMPFIAAAAVRALQQFPVVNASLAGNAIQYHGSVHLGIAVALEWGLIVPVVREAEKRSFKQLSLSIADLAERARAKKLKPEEASGSTFTLTNSGIFGGEFGTPIINQPESAILAIGGLHKEPVVVSDEDGNDSIAIRSIQTYCLGFDHRLIDGADAGRFMTAFKQALEGWDEEIG